MNDLPERFKSAGHQNLPVQSPRGEPLPRLQSYNQYPMHYENIHAMTADLSRIQAMGFTSVWSNPLFQPCESMEGIDTELRRGLHNAGYNETSRPHSKPGSPYAVKTLDINLKVSAHADKGLSPEDRKALDYADIRQYTDECRRLNLTPLSDFVMRHVSVDNALVAEKPHWFKRHGNGNFVFFGRDENYKSTGQSWDDVHEFNFEDPEIRNEIIKDYLKPMASIIIDKFGFEGLRIDAAGKIPTSVYQEIIPYIDDLCLAHHGKKAVILGETLGQNINEFLHLGGFADYVYNSIYFYPFTRAHWDHDDTPLSACKGALQDKVGPTVGFAGNHDVARAAEYYSNNQHIRGSFLKATIKDAGTNADVLGNVVRIFQAAQAQNAFIPAQLKKLENSFGIDQVNGSKAITPQIIRRKFNQYPVSTPEGKAMYDALTDEIFEVVKRGKDDPTGYYTADMPKNALLEKKLIVALPKNYDHKKMSARIKESFCFSAFASDGGWFFNLGDEWGVTKRTNVFNAAPSDLDERISPPVDFSKFIGSINRIVAALPPPTNPEWVQQCFLPTHEKDHELLAFYIHQGHGFTGTGHLIINNISEEPHDLTLDLFHQYRNANGRNSGPDKSKLPDALYICGKMTIDPELKTFLVHEKIRVVDSETELPFYYPEHYPAQLRECHF